MTLLHSGSVIEALSNIGIIKGPEARVFVVDPSDSGFTIQNAIDECIAAKGDVILMLPGASDVTTSVLFNKSGINVIAVNRGLNPMVDGEFHSILSNASYTNGPAATITASCRIIGMGFVSRDTGSLFFSGAACLLGGDGAQGAPPFGVQMKNCRFPKWGLDNRIGLAIEGSSNVLIEDTDFEGAFGAGIYVQGACGHLTVRKSHFTLMTYAIEHGSFSDAGVNTQFFYGPGNVTVGPTKGVKSNSSAAKVTIFGNYWATPVNSTHDQSIDDMESDGYICAGNYYADEERDDE
ncbi:hypothetical protein LCGC14_1608070 [marine sediment metagenome]|uniref:Right handed beta helix domain-containing protein n=1 Tax=marine sediment metagenome TaxID=412755 RepID=A0A0F9I948_9ZZZZ